MAKVQIGEVHAIDKEELSERVDLLTTLKLPESIIKLSPYHWYKTPAGAFMLRLPIANEYLEVFTDLTEHWTAKGTVNTNHFIRGGFKTLEEGIQFADGMLAMLGKGLLSDLKCKGRVNKAQATEAQWIMIRRMATMAEFRDLPEKVTHGDANSLIQKLMQLKMERAWRDNKFARKDTSLIDELEIIELRPSGRETRTHWSVQRVSDRHWLRNDNTLAPPTDEGFKSRRKFKYESLAFDGVFDFHMVQALKEKVSPAIGKRQ